MSLLILIAFIVILFFIFKKIWAKPKWQIPKGTVPMEWRAILVKNISFYSRLNFKKKALFEYKVQEFLLNHKITGIKTDVSLTDELLIASSAIIPIFSFPEWKYSNLFEILVYPDTFNEDFKFEGEDRKILGMVGTGFMQGKMILSKKAIRKGFANESDKKNTAIHEFVHLIDKLDGQTDGVPELLLEKQYVIPWLELIRSKIDDIYEGKTDINPYGGTNKQEFFAVTSEYFFEKPKLLAKKHPELHALLEQIFDQDFEILAPSNSRTQKEPGRNQPCYCGSGKKYKHCHLK
jgi:Mlc titration factor MtfA (ptsG expression regulator)